MGLWVFYDHDGYVNFMRPWVIVTIANLCFCAHIWGILRFVWGICELCIFLWRICWWMGWSNNDGVNQLTRQANVDSQGRGQSLSPHHPPLFSLHSLSVGFLFFFSFLSWRCHASLLPFFFSHDDVTASPTSHIDTPPFYDLRQWSPPWISILKPMIGL